MNNVSVIVSTDQSLFPIASLKYPFVVLYQCQDLFITSSQSSGGYGRPLLTQFFIYSDPVNENLNQFNTNFTAGPVNFLIPRSFLFESTIFASLSVENAFHNTDTVNASISVISSESAISVSYDSTISHVFLASKGATYLIYASSCHTEIGDVKINWKIVSIVNNNTAVNEALLWGSQTKKGLFIIPPNSVPANSYVVFESYVNDTTYKSIGNVLLPLHALQNSPNIIVDIANGTFSNWKNLKINANSTFDPNNQYPLIFNWSCINSQGTSCGNLIKNRFSSILSLNNYLISGISYFFTISVAKKGSSVSKNAKTSRVIQINSVNSTVPRINIYDEITQSQPVLISNNQPLILFANNSDLTNLYNYQWSCLTSATYSVLSPWNQNSLSILTSSLLPNQYYTFQLIVTSNQIQGVYTYEFIINSPPHLGTVSVNPLNGTEFLTLFEISAMDFIDDDQNYPLSYAFGYVDGNIERFLHLKNESSSYLTELPYTGGPSQVFVTVYNSFGSYQSYYTNVSVNINENYNETTLLSRLSSQSNSVFYDPQTTAGTLIMIGTGILNRDFTLYGQYPPATDSNLDLLQNAFTFCVNEVNSMLNNITFYSTQGIDTISSALLLITVNPNLVSSNNMKTMASTVTQFLNSSSNIYGISSSSPSNFLNSFINLAPINNTFLFSEPTSTLIMMNTASNIVSNTIISIGLGENNTITLSNGDLQISVISTNDFNNFSLGSQVFSSSYVKFPENLPFDLKNTSSQNIAVCLTTIGQKSVIQNLSNTISNRPSIVDVTIYDKASSLPLTFTLQSDYFTVSIPVEGLESNYKPQCIYLDPVSGVWNTSGCKLVEIKNDSVICQCNHLTTFSVSDAFDAGGSVIENTNLAAAFDIYLFNSINASNAAGLYVFIFFFILYIFLGILVRKIDSHEFSRSFTVDNLKILDLGEEILKEENFIVKFQIPETKALIDSEALIIEQGHNVSLDEITEKNKESLVHSLKITPKDASITHELPDTENKSESENKDSNVEKEIQEEIKEDPFFELFINDEITARDESERLKFYSVKQKIEPAKTLDWMNPSFYGDLKIRNRSVEMIKDEQLKDIISVNDSQDVIEVKNNNRKLENDLISKESTIIELLEKKQTVKEMIIQSHELFRLIYHPLKTESRFASLTLLFLKLLLQMFLIGLFYQSMPRTNSEQSYKSFSDTINSYTWDDFWITVYSGVIGIFIVTIITHLLGNPKVHTSHLSNLKNYLIRHKIKKIVGYFIAWTILMLSGWSIALFSIKFAGGTRSLWLLGATIGALIEICFTSLFKEIFIVYLRKYTVKIYRKMTLKI